MFAALSTAPPLASADPEFNARLIYAVILGVPAVLACLNYALNIWRHTRPTPALADVYATIKALTAAEARIEKLEVQVETDLRELKKSFEGVVNELRLTINQISQAQSDLNFTVGELRGQADALAQQQKGGARR